MEQLQQWKFSVLMQQHELVWQVVNMGLLAVIYPILLLKFMFLLTKDDLYAVF